MRTQPARGWSSAPRWTEVAAAALVALLPLLLVRLLPPGGVLGHTPDSLAYLDVAQQLRAGHGLRLPSYTLGQAEGSALTTWPPLFPLLLASGLPPVWLQALLLAALALSCHALLRGPLRTPSVAAVPLAWACSLSLPLLVDATYVWSELLALWLLTLGLLAMAGVGPRGGALRVALAAGCTLLAVYARYATALFVPGFALALLLLPAEGVAVRVRRVLGYGALMAIGVAPLALRNLLDSAHLSGAARGLSHVAAARNLDEALYALLNAFAVSGPWAGVFVVALLGVAAVVLFGALASLRRRAGGGGDEAPAPAEWLSRTRWLAGSALLMAALYALGMVLLRSRYHFDRLDTRLMSPAVLFLDLGLCATLLLVWRRNRHARAWERAIWVLPFVLLLAVSAQHAGHRSVVAWNAWRSLGNPLWPMNPVQPYANLHQHTVPPLAGVVLAPSPSLLAFQTGWKVADVPPPPWSAATLRRIAQQARDVVVHDARSAELALRLRPLVQGGHDRVVLGVHLWEWKAAAPH